MWTRVRPCKTEGELNMTKTPLGTWDIVGTLATGVSMQSGEEGELQITGIVTFQTGMEHVDANDEVSTGNATELELIGDVFAPAPAGPSLFSSTCNLGTF